MDNTANQQPVKPHAGLQQDLARLLREAPVWVKINDAEPVPATDVAIGERWIGVIEQTGPIVAVTAYTADYAPGLLPLQALVDAAVTDDTTTVGQIIDRLPDDERAVLTQACRRIAELAVP